MEFIHAEEKTISSEVSSFYFDNEEVENLVTIFYGKNKQERLVFVPNWKAKKKHWISFVSKLNETYKVEYFESREKMSTRHKQVNVGFTLDHMAKDLANYLNTSTEPYHLIGTSTGACSIIKAWKKLMVKPKTVTLICPILTLRMPVYFHLFRFIPEKLLWLTAPVIYQLMKRSKSMKHVTSALYKSYTQHDVSKLRIMRDSFRDILKMEMDLKDLVLIKCPVLIISAKHDRIHRKEDAQKISKILLSESNHELLNFKAVHQDLCARLVLDWINWKMS